MSESIESMKNKLDKMHEELASESKKLSNISESCGSMSHSDVMKARHDLTSIEIKVNSIRKEMYSLIDLIYGDWAPPSGRK